MISCTTRSRILSAPRETHLNIISKLTLMGSSDLSVVWELLVRASQPLFVPVVRAEHFYSARKRAPAEAQRWPTNNTKLASFELLLLVFSKSRTSAPRQGLGARSQPGPCPEALALRSCPQTHPAFLFGMFDPSITEDRPINEFRKRTPASVRTDSSHP